MWRLSWFLIYLVFVLLLTSVTTVMLYVLGVCHQSNGGLVFLLLLLYDLSVLALSFMITPFFDNAKVKCVSSMLIIAFPVSNSIQSYRTCKFVDKLLSFLFFFHFSFFIFHFFSKACRGIRWYVDVVFELVLLHSSCYWRFDRVVRLLDAGLHLSDRIRSGNGQSSYPWIDERMKLILSMIWMQILLLEMNSGGVNYETLWVGPGLPIAGSYIMLSIDIVLYMLLAFYLDNVLPSNSCFHCRRY